VAQLFSLGSIAPMKSLLRIIIGVLVGVCCFIGIAFVIAFLARLFHVEIPFAKADFIGRCIDNAIYIGAGIAVIFAGPKQIRRSLESGKMTEAKAQRGLKIIVPVGILMVVFGIFKIFVR
jgi:hypothetical protein